MEKGVKWRWKKMVKKKKVIIGVTGVILISVISGGIFLLHGKSTLAMKTESVVQTAKAEKGSISNTVTGTGNLEADTAQDIEIPSSILIDQVLVESGDHVSAGDVLATVDNTSVLSALQEMQETVGDLDEEINEKKDDLMEDTIETQVSGRVKKIYVSSGDSVSDSMVNNGALMLLSVDGKMSLTLTGVSGVASGDSVNVNLSDGSVEEGTVESLSGGNCVITLTDDGVAYGDTATVTTTDGTELGSGTLGIHQQLSIMGTAGTVSGVSVSENENVDSGETLLSLTDVPSSTEYQELLAQREAAAATMYKLLKLSQTGNITSEMDGTIQNVNISSNSSSVSSSSSSSSGTSDSAGSSAVKTSTGSGIAGSGAVTNYVASLLQYNGGTATLTAESDNGLGDDSSVSISSREDQEETEDEEDSSLNIQIGSSSEKEGVNLVIATPETDGQSQTKISTDESSGFTGTISWNPSDGTFHESSVYQANITLSANEGYHFEAGSITKIEIGTVSGITVGDSGKTLSFMVTFPKTAAKQTDTENKDEGSSGSGNSSGSNNTNASTNTSANTSASGSGSAGNSSVKASSNSGSSTSGSTSSGSSGSGSNSTSSSSSGSDSSSTSTEDHTDVTAFTISSDENMILSVNVDELDINSIALDQEAEVTFDAIEEGSFTGTITSIGSTANASGGVAKYAVSVSIPKDEQMKVGMNASAVITIENKENIITIPMNALQERGGSSFVYTSQEEDGSLSGEVEVTTGLSDGSTVEITEGLSEGDTVYYQKTGSSDSSSKDIQMPDFGNMNGEMPSGGKPDFGGGNGGSRPSGGGTGGQ